MFELNVSLLHSRRRRQTEMRSIIVDFLIVIWLAANCWACHSVLQDNTVSGHRVRAINRICHAVNCAQERATEHHTHFPRRLHFVFVNGFVRC